MRFKGGPRRHKDIEKKEYSSLITDPGRIAACGSFEDAVVRIIDGLDHQGLHVGALLDQPEGPVS